MPMLTQMEEEFQITKKQLDLPAGIQLRPPAHFEGNRYGLQFEFGSREELDKVLKKLNHRQKILLIAQNSNIGGVYGDESLRKYHGKSKIEGVHFTEHLVRSHIGLDPVQSRLVRFRTYVIHDDRAHTTRLQCRQ